MRVERRRSYIWCKIPLGNLISFGKFGPFVHDTPSLLRGLAVYHHHHHLLSRGPSSSLPNTRVLYTEPYPYIYICRDRAVIYIYAHNGRMAQIQLNTTRARLDFLVVFSIFLFFFFFCLLFIRRKRIFVFIARVNEK